MGKGWFGLGKNDGKGDKEPKPEHDEPKLDPAEEWAKGWYERTRTGITPDLARECIGKADGWAGLRCLSAGARSQGRRGSG